MRRYIFLFNPFFLILFLCYSIISNEDDLDDNAIWNSIRFKNLTDSKINLSIGSGFFISENQIITNHHVVEGCRNIAIRGAVKPCLATLQFFDAKNDIAVLKIKESNNTPRRIAVLRKNTKEVHLTDKIFSIGYPLDYGKRGKFVILPGEITNIRKNSNLLNLFEFTDSVDHGNSGGPLLDKDLNIIGVVTSRVTYSDENNNQESFGSAISIEWVMNFLDANNVKYGINYSYSTNILSSVSSINLQQAAKNYAVNIHCVK